MYYIDVSTVSQLPCWLPMHVYDDGSTPARLVLMKRSPLPSMSHSLPFLWGTAMIQCYTVRRKVVGASYRSARKYCVYITLHTVILLCSTYFLDRLFSIISLIRNTTYMTSRCLIIPEYLFTLFRRAVVENSPHTCHLHTMFDSSRQITKPACARAWTVGLRAMATRPKEIGEIVATETSSARIRVMKFSRTRRCLPFW